MRFRPRLGHLAVLAIGFALLAAAGGAPRVEDSVTEPLRPVKVTRLAEPSQPRTILPAPVEERASTPQVRTRSAQPAAQQAPAARAPGGASVTIQNGSNSTETESGGATYSNAADVSARSSAFESGP